MFSSKVSLKNPKDKIGVSLSDKISFKKTGAQCVEKEKGTFSGWVGEQIACKRAYLTYLTNPIRLPDLEPI